MIMLECCSSTLNHKVLTMPVNECHQSDALYDIHCDETTTERKMCTCNRASYWTTTNSMNRSNNCCVGYCTRVNAYHPQGSTPFPVSSLPCRCCQTGAGVTQTIPPACTCIPVNVPVDYYVRELNVINGLKYVVKPVVGESVLMPAVTAVTPAAHALVPGSCNDMQKRVHKFEGNGRYNAVDGRYAVHSDVDSWRKKHVEHLKLQQLMVNEVPKYTDPLSASSMHSEFGRPKEYKCLSYYEASKSQQLTYIAATSLPQLDGDLVSSANGIEDNRMEVDIAATNEKVDNSLHVVDDNLRTSNLRVSKEQQTDVPTNQKTDEYHQTNVLTNQTVDQCQQTDVLINQKRTDQHQQTDVDAGVTVENAGVDCFRRQVQTLQVEVRRQEMKVKLYEAMLRRSRHDADICRNNMKQELEEYKTRICSLEEQLSKSTPIAEVICSRCKSSTAVSQDSCHDDVTRKQDLDESIPDMYLSRTTVEEDNEAGGENEKDDEAYSSCTSPTQSHVDESAYAKTPVGSESRQARTQLNVERRVFNPSLSEDNVNAHARLADYPAAYSPTSSSLRYVDTSSPIGSSHGRSEAYSSFDSSRLSVSLRQISEEELTTGALREEVARRDRNLKILRDTLKQMSARHQELLEKNVALERRLETNPCRSGSSSSSASSGCGLSWDSSCSSWSTPQLGAGAAAVREEARLVVGLRRCVADLRPLVQACTVVAGDGQNVDVARLLSASSEGLESSERRGATDPITQLHRDVEELKHLLMTRDGVTSNTPGAQLKPSSSLYYNRSATAPQRVAVTPPLSRSLDKSAVHSPALWSSTPRSCRASLRTGAPYVRSQVNPRNLVLE